LVSFKVVRETNFNSFSSAWGIKTHCYVRKCAYFQCLM
jgi:hypothetical protein